MKQQSTFLDAPNSTSRLLSSSSSKTRKPSTLCSIANSIIHILIAIALITLYILALIKNAMYANLLCYYENALTGETNPCVGQNDEEVGTVYSTSVLTLIKDSWQSKDYHISIILLLLSLVFPFFQIINNLRLVFRKNASVKPKKNKCSNYGSILFTFLNKTTMAYLFGCILFINSLYQSISTETGIPLQTLNQRIVIEADIAINILIIAMVISCIWTVYIQYISPENNTRLFGYHRYIYFEGVSQLLVIIVLVLCAGIMGLVTYFLGINFIKFEYIDDWGLYDVIFDNEERIYDFISVIEDIGDKNEQKNNTFLTIFYYGYGIVMPMFSYITCIVLCLVLKYYQFQIRKILLMFLFYVFLCFNGFDMLIISTIAMKYLLPEIWDSIMNSIYEEFCHEFFIIGEDKLCNDLDVEVTLLTGMWIGVGFIVVMFSIFCCINDDCWCNKDAYSRYKKDTKGTMDNKSIVNETTSAVGTELFSIDHNENDLKRDYE